ncbi:glycerol dehydrogenase [Pseudothauera nasutitermitis]|uniref:Glycerol dehydrogenase n=1 Tax=Pseudothauera nasutitermitis TaxID=2565930 RepID=A0A4S4B3U5_9RHOO|nr:glycerol dehydrogenase [Pseudothauera nasutitermitis]THF66400.1 glycerol dehydrogenase [Pseudothauera nasutitermitis]
MITTAIFPGRYVQGAGALAVLGEETARQGRKALLICDPFVLEHLMPEIETGLGQHLPWVPVRFGGECSDEEVARLKTQAEKDGADVIVGIGGGKTLDTAKAVAYALGARTVIVPTLASTDAPCSALSVIYQPDGSFKRYLVLPHNPDVVLVDTGVIVRAPVRLLVAGMGDAFATWFEADHCRATRGSNMTGRQGPLTAYALARLCHETLLEYGPLAKLSAEQGVVTPALEHIVEANTLLSGLGFESGGLAAAHAIHNGLTALPESHHAWHGEKVAIGIQAMMFLADQKPELIETVFDFSEAVGLPTTLADIGLGKVTGEQLLIAAAAACVPGETIHNEPTEITPQRVLAALKVADAEGRRRKALRG